MNVLAQTIQKEQRYLYIASSVMLCLFVAYIYFLSATVMHVVVRKEVSQSITELNSEISKLEARYIAAQHSVSEEVADLQGFVETGEKIFINRAPSTLVLSANIE